MPRTAPLLAALALAAGLAVAQPAIEPDETVEAFVARWNEWAERTDPDQRLLATLETANEAINAALADVTRREGVRATDALRDPESPEHRSIAQRAAERMAPHTSRIRAALASPHAALRFPSIDFPANPHARSAASLYQTVHTPFFPRNHAELIHFGINEGSRPIRSAAMHLGNETRASIAADEPALAADNIRAMIGAARLAAERPTTSDALQAVGVEALALHLLGDLLHRHGRGMPDATLARLQQALLDAPPIRTTERTSLADRANTELLAGWFDPQRPDRLGPRGRAWLGTLLPAPAWRAGEPMTLSVTPDADAAFAPAEEQTRVYRSIAEAYIRDATTPQHERTEFEASRLFNAVLEADRPGRLIPALSLFGLHASRISIDNRSALHRSATLTILAVHRHHARTGAWPESLADIDPAVMRAAPTDPHTGEPFGYAVIDAQPTLWSAGPDRKNDDARPTPEPPAPPEGQLPRIPEHRWFTLNEWNAMPPEARAEYDGDIILYPPQN